MGGITGGDGRRRQRNRDDDRRPRARCGTAGGHSPSLWMTRRLPDFFWAESPAHCFTNLPIGCKGDK
uniref:Uncharacterized protein n=1 Tax=Oryza meridionalis TaxID=40149 RepID=A0A0E0DJ86_9ORYZ